ncbi:MAG TPA: hypothetical protein ENN51_01505 [candidate division WOR-3 bacterium]|uniref:Uncharacterized protein n=1 Tax=candidate division WOR-3 bacterium TaxID=2052148 RepID=A0A7V0T4D8_UNCW3|nr:hypothetical protein [candidate division WOR-3 bacterium]
MRAGISRVAAVVSVLLLFRAGCRHAVNVGPPVEPEQAVAEASERLGRLESFAFRFSWHTDRPFELGADFSGVRDSTDREFWRGTWYRGSSRSSFIVVGDGEVQYELLDGGWSREPRGIESRVLDHIEQVLRTPEFRFHSETGRTYRYEFDPKLPVLDPSGQKRIRGELELCRQTGLLLRASCREENGPVRWELRLSGFNRAGRVTVPFVPVQELAVAPVGRAGRRELGHAVRTVAARLDVLERRHRFFRASPFDRDRRWGQLVLQLEREEPSPVIERLLGPGHVELWTAEGIGPTVPAPEGVVEIGGDASRLARPTRLLGGNGDFAVSTELEFLSRPTLVVAGREGAALPEGELVLLVVDGRTLDAARVREGRLEFVALGGREQVKALVAVASLPASAGLRVLSARSLKARLR